MENKLIKASKIRLLSIVLVLYFSLLLGFLFRWQIIEHDTFVSLANERIKDNKVPSIRGEILARDESALAYSEPTFNIIVYKVELEFAEEHDWQDREEFVKKISEIIELPEEEVREELKGEHDWIYLIRDVSNEKKEQLLDLKTDNNPKRTLDGLRIEYSSVRIYPEDTLAAHLIGFVGKNEIGESSGRAGLEGYWEGLLKPREGFELGEVDSFGNVIALEGIQSVEARRGASIYTTIDKRLQEKVEKHIEAGVKRFDAISGSAIIMDPKTGAILALANFPSFNPNLYSEVEDEASFKNVAITDPAELGSVGKVFTVAGALNEGLIEPNSQVTSGHQGCTVVKEKERDWKICTYDKKPQPAMNTTQALVKSDNLAIFEISKKLGQEGLHDYLTGFGIGDKSNIDMSGESYGFLKEIEDWTNVDSATFAFGHGYQMTALQAISGIGAVANDGKRMQPYIVEKMVESDGNEKIFKPRIMNEVVSPQTADKMQDMLYEVFKSNLSENRYKGLAQYKIAMKSGTATIPFKDKAGYSKEVNATYVGFDASDQSTFIMLVKLEEPKAVEKLSYYSARVVWLDLFNDIKDDLGVPKVGGN